MSSGNASSIPCSSLGQAAFEPTSEPDIAIFTTCLTKLVACLLLTYSSTRGSLAEHAGIIYRGHSKPSRWRTAIEWPSVADHLARETRIPIYYGKSDDVKGSGPAALLPGTFKVLQTERLTDRSLALWHSEAASAA